MPSRRNPETIRFMFRFPCSAFPRLRLVRGSNVLPHSLAPRALFVSLPPLPPFLPVGRDVSFALRPPNREIIPPARLVPIGRRRQRSAPFVTVRAVILPIAAGYSAQNTAQGAPTKRQPRTSSRLDARLHQTNTTSYRQQQQKEKERSLSASNAIRCIYTHWGKQQKEPGASGWRLSDDAPPGHEQRNRYEAIYFVGRAPPSSERGGPTKAYFAHHLSRAARLPFCRTSNIPPVALSPHFPLSPRRERETRTVQK